MSRERTITALCGCLGMLVLILDAKTALIGAREGIELCLWTIVPALFPFFVAANYLTGSLSPGFLRPVVKLLRIPEGAEGILLIGMLGGYPVGAQCIGREAESGRLAKADAKRMLGFCSNAGPAFLFGVVGQQLGDFRPALGLWVIHLGSAVLTALLLPHTESVGNAPVSHHRQGDPMGESVRAIGYVCGWVILLRVVIGVADRWFGWLLPQPWHTIAVGLLELTNGCCTLGAIPQKGAQFVICAGLLGFGSLCVLLQTMSVTKACGLGMYIPGKGMQGCLSMLLAFAAQPLFFPKEQRMDFSPRLLILLIACVLIGITIRKKTVEKPRSFVYTKERLA